MNNKIKFNQQYGFFNREFTLWGPYFLFKMNHIYDEYSSFPIIQSRHDGITFLEMKNSTWRIT
jgi:hypothetical protein